MQNLENPTDVEIWLKDQSREVSIAVASRAAMRVFPLIVRATPSRGSSTWETGILLRTFRTMAVSWAAASYLNHDNDLRVYALDAANAGHAATVPIQSTYPSSAHAATAAAHAADAAASSDAGVGASYALANVTYAATATDAVKHASAFDDDTIVIESGETTPVLCRLPLWSSTKPIWFVEYWQNLQKILSSEGLEDENWQVWTNWFNARINGAPANEKLELARATIEDEIWQQGPKVVNAHIQGLIDQFTTKLKQNSLGNTWIETGTSFTINKGGDETDVAAANDSVTQQLHQSIRKKTVKFADKCKGIDDKIGWSDFEDAVQQFVTAIDIETAEVPDTIAIVYDTTITLASFLEQDNDLREAPVGNMGPLDADVRRMFVDVVRTAAPWVRRFPTARELDDETGKFLTNKDLFEPSRSIIADAGESGLISQGDRDLIISLLAALERAGLPAQKAGNRGFLSARNLVIVTASFFSGAIASNYSGKSELIDKAGSFLARNEKAVTEIVSELPADIQATFKEIYHDWPLK